MVVVIRSLSLIRARDMENLSPVAVCARRNASETLFVVREFGLVEGLRRVGKTFLPTTNYNVNNRV